MTNILDNELVRKYFSCDCGLTNDRSYVVVAHMRACSSMKILSAMQEPFNDHDRFLGWDVKTGAVVEIDDYHTLKMKWVSLRLPDRFQKKECPWCEEHGGCRHFCQHMTHKPAPEPLPNPHRTCGILSHKMGCDCDLRKPEPSIKRTCDNPDHMTGCMCSPPEPCYVCDGTKLNDKPGAVYPVCEFHLKNPPEPEKSDYQWEGYGHCRKCGNIGPEEHTCKPSSAVEEKIADLIQRYVGLYSAYSIIPIDDIEGELRALVALARKSK